MNDAFAGQTSCYNSSVSNLNELLQHYGLEAVSDGNGLEVWDTKHLADGSVVAVCRRENGELQFAKGDDESPLLIVMMSKFDATTAAAILAAWTENQNERKE